MKINILIEELKLLKNFKDKFLEQRKKVLDLNKKYIEDNRTISNGTKVNVYYYNKFIGIGIVGDVKNLLSTLVDENINESDINNIYYEVFKLKKDGTKSEQYFRFVKHMPILEKNNAIILDYYIEPIK